jgi:hypothetical protein
MNIIITMFTIMLFQDLAHYRIIFMTVFTTLDFLVILDHSVLQQIVK